MNYTVMQKRGKQIIGWVSAAVFLIFLIFGVWVFFAEPGEANDTTLVIFFFGFFGGFTLLSAYMVYSGILPRIRVSGEKITVYPLWKRKIELNMRDITRRNKDIFNDNTVIIGGTANGYGTTELKITYYVGDEKLITTNTTMINAGKFDADVGKMLAERENVFMSR